MANEVRTRPLPPAAAAAVRPEVGIMDRVDGALEALWHFLSSMRVAMVLILALAVLAWFGTLIIQAPPGMLADADAKKTWFGQIGPLGLPIVGWMRTLPVIGGVVPDLHYRDVTGLFDTLQLFQIFNSLVFRILVAALTISLIACSVQRFPGMLRTATKPRVDVGAGFFEHAPQHEAIVVRHTPAETQAIVQRVLRARHYRTLAMDDGAIHLYADRFRWAPFAGLLGHLALVVILAGAIIGSTFGFRNGDFTIAEGATLPVASEPGLTLKLVDFTDTYYTTTGAPEDYASQVVLYQDGTEVERHTIRVNDPLRYGDTSFYQSYFGSAAVMTVKDASGNTLVSQGVPLAWRTTADNRPIGTFSIPGTDFVAWVVGTLGQGDTTIKPGQVQVELYTADGSQPVGQQVVDQGKAATVGAFSVTFDRESQYTGLSVARDPGVMFVWLGALLLTGGFAIRLLVPHKRVWGRVVGRPNGGAALSLASLGNREAALSTDFESLMNDIRAALQAPVRG